MKRILKRILPETLVDRIRHSGPFTRKVARRYARSSKRLDICAAQLAHYLHLSNHPPLADKVCLEIGSGWVLSHAVVCYLLGARRVIATDIFPYARPQALYRAVHDSIVYLPRDILSPFADHSLIRKRFDHLLSIRHFSFEALSRLGIDYVAPIDFAKVALHLPVDFIYSISAFEHVPCADIPAVLRNLVVNLRPGGTMIHCIHLEDHKDSLNDPFAFLSIPSDQYPRTQQTLRGNRTRSNRWRQLFGALENTESTFLYEWTRNDRDLPARIDPSVLNSGEADLRVSHIGIYTTKSPAGRMQP